MGIECLVCGAQIHPTIYHETRIYQVFRCPECTVAWWCERTKPEDLSYDWGGDIVRESDKRSRMYKDRIRRIEEWHPHPRVWIDIGCGGGGMLRQVINAGFSAEGIEPSPAGDIVAADLGIPIHKKGLSQVRDQLTFVEYGVVSYFHVLEHLSDPLPEILAARKLLSTKGILIVEVPFFDTLAWKVLRARHRHFYRGHRFYYNKKSITALLNRARLRIVRYERVPYVMSLDWLLMRVGGFLASLRNRLPLALAEKSIRIDPWDILMVIAQRTE